jgi:phosphate-selective porin OprO/OprP
MKYLVSLMLLCSAAAYAQDTPATVPVTEPAVVVAPVVIAPAAGATVGYDKGFFIQSADERFKLTMSGYIQGLFDARFVEAGGDTDTFRVRRARLTWAGYAYSKNIQYNLEYDLPSNTLLEATITLIANDQFHYKLGQYHVPFTLENMTSSSTLQFVDRSIVHTFFGLPNEREPGTGFNGAVLDKKLEYDVGVFNGEGVNTINLNNELRYAGRFVFNIAGNPGTEFADTKISKDPQVAIGAAGMFNDTPDPATIPAGGTLANATSEKKVYTAVGDVHAKYEGFSGFAEFLYQRNNPDVGLTTKDKGWMEQMGYMITPKFEVAERVAQIYPEATHDTAEYTLGLNYYLFDGHRVKFQMDYSALTEKDGVAVGNNRLDYRVRAQFQIKI